MWYMQMCMVGLALDAMEKAPKKVKSHIATGIDSRKSKGDKAKSRKERRQKGDI